MNQSIFPLLDKESSMEILKRDACYGKIPPERVIDIFEDAWRTGVEEARKFVYSSCWDAAFDMPRILEGMGFRIIWQDADYVMGNIRYFCEYFPEKKRIHIYSRGVGLWAAANNLDQKQAENIILAHEFFHYLESNELGWMSKRCLVPMLKIGKAEIGKTGIAALSEVAANAFANEFYGAYTQFLEALEA